MLEFLGNRKQRRSYTHVDYCVRAMLKLRSEDNFEIFNIGHDYFISVTETATLVASALNLFPTYKFGSENRGWIGDNPFTFLDISKAKLAGWSPTISIEDSIQSTVEFLINNIWVLNKTDNRPT